MVSADENGGGDFQLVTFDRWGKPSCVRHGAMNKVSPTGLWRCVTTSGPKFNPCRAACEERPLNWRERTVRLGHEVRKALARETI